MQWLVLVQPTRTHYWHALTGMPHDRSRAAWRTGSPDRLNALISNQSWDPSLMFGARPPARREPPPRPPPAAAAPAPPQPAAPQPRPRTEDPAWCVLPRQPCVTRLAVHRGQELVEVVPLGLRPSFVAGRSPECDIVLEHPSASRRHATVMHHRSGSVYLVDNGSAHGTFLGGQRLPHHEPTVWPEGVGCVFGASTRSYVLLCKPAKPAPAATPPSQPTPQRASPAVSAVAPAAAVATGAAASSSEAEEGEDEEGDEYVLDDECEENTRRNTSIEVRPEGPRQSKPWRQRRSVRFDSKPQLRYYEVVAPEPIMDPEASGQPVTAGAAASAAAVERAEAAPRPVGPSRVTAQTTTTRVAVGAASAAGAVGQFGGLSSVTMVPSAGPAPIAPSPRASAAVTGSSAAVAMQQRLQALYADDDDDAEADEDGSGAVGSSPKRVFAKERWYPAPKRARTAAAAAATAAAALPPPPSHLRLETHSANAAVEWIESDSAAVTFGGAAGASLLRLVFGRAISGGGPVAAEDESLNPLHEGPRAMAAYQAHGGGGVPAVRRGAVAASWRALAGATPLRVSVVNLQPRPVLVYMALLPPGSEATEAAAGAAARALTPWADVTAAECPAALSLPPPARGANCLLLAPHEGLPHCEAEDAERAPFGESNTFAYVAESGASLTLDAAADLRIEAAYQAAGGDHGGGGASASLLGDAYADDDDGGGGSEAMPEAPFCVAILPLRLE